MIKVLLADDHEIERIGLLTLIKNFALDAFIDEAPDAGTVYEKVRSNNFDLIILDVIINGITSFDLVKSIIVMKPGSRILMFSNYNEKLYAKKYLQLGAMGYIMKDVEQKEIRKGIENILMNKRYVSGKVLAALAQDCYKNKLVNPS